MGLFKFSGKDKNGNIEVRFSYVDGIPNLFTVLNEVVDVTIDDIQGKLLIKSCLSKKRTASLDLNKIKDVRHIDEVQIQEVSKSVLGRAVVGNLLLGPLGGIIGGMSGIGKKEQKSRHKFVIITYISDDIEKQLVFEIVGASTGWQKFVEALPKDENSPFKNSSQHNVEL